MKTILATTSSFGTNNQSLLNNLIQSGFNLVTNPFERKLTEKELIQLLEQHRPEGLLAGTEPIGPAAIDSSKQFLKIISRVGVGWDNVDRECAQKNGIKVFRTVGVLNQAVAELALGMILCALRNVSAQDRQIRNGIWKKQMGRLLAGKVVGIIGFGEIGQCLGRLIQTIGGKVQFYDPRKITLEWAEQTSLEELLKTSDIISLHASGGDQILGKEEIALIRGRGTIIVNLARGGLIDEQALYQFLKEEPLAYACLDVFEKEPYTGNLTTLDNVVLTSHIGSYAKEARIEMEKMAVDNLIKEFSE